MFFSDTKATQLVRKYQQALQKYQQTGSARHLEESRALKTKLTRLIAKNRTDKLKRRANVIGVLGYNPPKVNRAVGTCNQLRQNKANGLILSKTQKMMLKSCDAGKFTKAAGRKVMSTGRSAQGAVKSAGQLVKRSVDKTRAAKHTVTNQVRGVQAGYAAYKAAKKASIANARQGRRAVAAAKVWNKTRNDPYALNFSQNGVYTVGGTRLTTKKPVIKSSATTSVLPKRLAYL
jgi:hypothetical protein